MAAATQTLAKPSQPSGQSCEWSRKQESCYGASKRRTVLECRQEATRELKEGLFETRLSAMHPQTSQQLIRVLVPPAFEDRIVIIATCLIHTFFFLPCRGWTQRKRGNMPLNENHDCYVPCAGRSSWVRGIAAQRDPCILCPCLCLSPAFHQRSCRVARDKPRSRVIHPPQELGHDAFRGGSCAEKALVGGMMYS